MVKSRAGKKASGWLQVIKAVSKKNPGKPLSQVLKLAKKEWAKVKSAK